MAPVLKQMTSMVENYMDKFQHRKKEQAIVDFNDLEHYCLEILMETDEEGALIGASSIAMQLQSSLKRFSLMSIRIQTLCRKVFFS